MHHVMINELHGELVLSLEVQGEKKRNQGKAYVTSSAVRYRSCNVDWSTLYTHRRCIIGTAKLMLHVTDIIF